MTEGAIAGGEFHPIRNCLLPGWDWVTLVDCEDLERAELPLGRTTDCCFNIATQGLRRDHHGDFEAHCRELGDGLILEIARKRLQPVRVDLEDVGIMGDSKLV